MHAGSAGYVCSRLTRLFRPLSRARRGPSVSDSSGATLRGNTAIRRSAGTRNATMRIFLSFNTKDLSLAEALRERVRAIDSDVTMFFSPVSLGAGFWVPKLADELAAADAFLLLI